ncbi:MAG: hypothetical protein JWR80_6380 [Bradyrhizobium sp.]|nr:hypothetical protein [Bradyrhizobium sp.]
MQTQTQELFIGIDVSKARLDWGIYPGAATAQATCANDEAGRAELVKTLLSMQPTLWW